MTNPNSLTTEMESFARVTSKRPPAFLELTLSWKDIATGLDAGWKKKFIWEWLVSNKRFSYNYSTFLRMLSRQMQLIEEQKRKESIEKRRSDLAKQKLSEDERLKAIFKDYEQE